MTLKTFENQSNFDVSEIQKSAVEIRKQSIQNCDALDLLDNDSRQTEKGNNDKSKY